MRILFDHNVNRRFKGHLPGHQIETARDRGWEILSNDKLLAAAALAGFDLFLSIDKKLEYEQNLGSLPLTVIVIDAYSNALPMMLPFAPILLTLLESPLPRAMFILTSAGVEGPLKTPRQ